jgi:hypothetical protein
VFIVSDLTKGIDRHYGSKLSSHKLREVDRGRIGKIVVGITPVVVMLLSCRSSNLSSQGSWNTYRNPRYGFEFPHPSKWVAFPIPDNRDGRAFRDPQNPSAEIRGWAVNKLSETKASSTNTSKHSQKSQQQNFTTAQGLTGNLQVEIGSDTSLMTLTLSRGKVLYNWQGQCSSKQFASYYRFFSYVAGQYRLPPPKEP